MINVVSCFMGFLCLQNSSFQHHFVWFIFFNIFLTAKFGVDSLLIFIFFCFVREIHRFFFINFFVIVCTRVCRVG